MGLNDALRRSFVLVLGVGLVACGERNEGPNDNRRGSISALYLQNGSWVPSGTISVPRIDCWGEWDDAICDHIEEPNEVGIALGFLTDYRAMPDGSVLSIDTDFTVGRLIFRNFSTQPGLSYFNNVDDGHGDLTVKIGSGAALIEGTVSQPTVTLEFSGVRVRLP